MGTRQPVLLVHGYNSNAKESWAKTIPRSRDTALTLFCTDRLWSDAFNYGDRLLKGSDPSYAWVTDPRIGPALATRIINLANESAAAGGPGKVALVGHSMGGLAIRCALAGACNGHQGDLADKVAAVVTLDTPNLGTLLQSNGSDRDAFLVNVLTTFTTSACYAAEGRAGWAGQMVEFLTGFCDRVRGMASGPAAHAFRPGSHEQQALDQVAHHPAAVPLTALAGSVLVKTTIFANDFTIGDAGDLIVEQSSAFNEAALTPGAHQIPIDCGNLNVVNLGLKSEIPKCWHGTETYDARFLAAAKKAIGEVAAQPPGPPLQPACDAAAIATDLGLNPADISLGECHGAWADAGVCPYPGPAEGCVDDGKWLHHIAGRWVIVGYILQDCMSDAIAQHIPGAVARQFSFMRDCGPPAPPAADPAAGMVRGLRAIGSAPPDLHNLRWDSVALPGNFCSVPGLVTFDKNGEATAMSTTQGPVHLGRFDQIVYGRVYGDSRPEAAVEVVCDNGGGTAGGQLAFAYLVLTSLDGKLAVVGTVTPQQNPPDQHVTLFDTVDFPIELSPGRVRVHERWYHPGDPTCCPKGTAITVWTLRGTDLVASAPTAVR